MNGGEFPAAGQLALPFVYTPRFRAEDFVAAPSNAAARLWLGGTADWPQHRLALWGQAGCGKTHLLRLWADRHGALRLAGPSLLSLPELGGCGAIALDDAEAVADERTLLHLINLASEMRRPVLLAARQPPARWPVRLPDLGSRLRAMTAVAVAPAEDALLRALLARLFSDRQLLLSEALQELLLAKLPRHPAALRAAAAWLDAQALAAGRRVSRAMAAALIARMDGGPGDVSDMSSNEPSPSEAILL